MTSFTFYSSCGGVSSLMPEGSDPPSSYIRAGVSLPPLISVRDLSPSNTVQKYRVCKKVLMEQPVRERDPESGWGKDAA